MPIWPKRRPGARPPKGAAGFGGPLPRLERTLADRERVLGGDHPGTLVSRSNLANAYRKAGRLAEAVPLFERTVADRERLLGGDHRDTLAARNNLANAYLDAGRLAEAVPLLERTVVDSERVLGGDHPGTLTVRENLASAYLQAGRLAEAVPLFERTVAVAEWLAAAGFATADFGGMLDPGLTGLLDAACARYASVIDDQAALELMRSGQPADGEVLAARKLDMPPELLPSPQTCVAWLTLAVTPQGGARYQVTMRFGFRSPERFTALATVGTKLPLRVDPADPRTVTIDLPALRMTPG